VRATSTKDE
jgi:hypothetical protein